MTITVIVPQQKSTLRRVQIEVAVWIAIAVLGLLRGILPQRLLVATLEIFTMVLVVLILVSAQPVRVVIPIYRSPVVSNKLKVDYAVVLDCNQIVLIGLEFRNFSFWPVVVILING